MIRILLLAALIGLPMLAKADDSKADDRTPETRLAIVAQDRVALRAAPRDSALLHVMLWQGDTLEVRGQKLDFLQVYDHARERAGYVRASQVRQLDLSPEHADSLLAVLQFLRDSPGDETLGIAYAAAYLKAVPAGQLRVDAFDALGVLAERLALRASASQVPANAEQIAAHLAVARQYGIRLISIESEARVQLCYDGDAFRRVLAMPADASQQARAALAVTRPTCIDPTLPPRERHVLDQWRADVLDKVRVTELPDWLRQRMNLRIAAVRAGLAFSQTRQGLPAQAEAQRALTALASIQPAALAESDRASYDDAAIRVGASRWAAEPEQTERKGLQIRARKGTQAGETCLELVATHAPTAKSLFTRCTFSQPWLNSQRGNQSGDALMLAVQPLSGWRELWVFRKTDGAWRVDILPPGSDTPELGYLEFAGWIPGERRFLAARETRVDGRFIKRFELISLDSLNVEKGADDPSHLSPFYRWQDAQWKAQTVSLR